MKYEYDNSEKLNAIEVTLAMGCRLDCHYCPQKLLLSRYFFDNINRPALMKFDDFKRILDKVKRGGTICFSGMCEAFLNPECDEMILYAYENGFKINLLTTLTGFRKESFKKLERVKFDEVTLHVPDAEGRSKFDITDEYLENLRVFHEKFKVTNYSCHGSIHPAVKKYIDKECSFSNIMHDRAGNLDCTTGGYNPKGEIICMVGTIGSYGNWTPEVLPDGTLLLCCMDYGMKHVLGNLLDMSVSEILKGIEYQKVQKGMQEGGVDILCRKCIGAMEIRKTPAYRFKDMKQKYDRNEELDGELRKTLELFNNSSEICVFGLGKLFWENFFSHRWNEVLGQTCFCDNSEELWGKIIDGVRCISPMELSGLSNPLIITHISDDTAVRQQLNDLGIKNIVNIKDIYRMV